MEESIRVLVVDDFEPWRRFACSTLQKEPKHEVVGEASDGVEAVRRAQELQPDVVLLDIGMPGLNGIEAAKQIVQVSPHSRIIFVTQESDIEIREAALATGAHGYLIKSNGSSGLIAAIANALRR